MSRFRPSMGIAFCLTSFSCVAATRPPPSPATAAGASSETALLPGAPPLELEAREELPSKVLEILDDKMIRHGDRMMALFAGVLMLDNQFTAHFAETLGSEPAITRPAPDERDTLSALLPPRFFDYQDAMLKSARELAAAARAGQSQVLVHSFAALTETCVGCHMTYLHDRVDDLERDHQHEEGVPTPPNAAERTPKSQGRPSRGRGVTLNEPAR